MKSILLLLTIFGVPNSFGTEPRAPYIQTSVGKNFAQWSNGVNIFTLFVSDTGREIFRGTFIFESASHARPYTQVNVPEGIQAELRRMLGTIK